MTDFKNIEEAYGYYLQHPEKEIVYDGIRFFRLIYKTGLYLNGAWTMQVVVPIELLAGKSLPIIVEDVVGEKISLTLPGHYFFRGWQPDWCLNTRTFSIPHIPDVDWYLGIPNEVEMTPDQIAQEQSLKDRAPTIVSEITKSRSIRRPEGVEEWDGGIDVNHRWQFSSEAERIAVLRYHMDTIRSRRNKTL